MQSPDCSHIETSILDLSKFGIAANQWTGLIPFYGSKTIHKNGHKESKLCSHVNHHVSANLESNCSQISSEILVKYGPAKAERSNQSSELTTRIGTGTAKYCFIYRKIKRNIWVAVLFYLAVLVFQVVFPGTVFLILKDHFVILYDFSKVLVWF
jgi:hypothetical protein